MLLRRIFYSFLAIAGIGILYGVNWLLDQPSAQQLARQLQDVSSYHRIEIKDQKNNPISSKDSRGVSDYASLDQIPKDIVNVFIYAEDKNFYQHSGVDFVALFRATLRNAKSARFQQGASTITQQLVRMYFLDRNKTIGRKLKELVYANKVDRVLSKNKILEIYLNNIYFGNRAYGLADASKRYFSKSYKDLTLGEAGLLASVIVAPSRLALNKNYHLAWNRQQRLFARMGQAGRISKETWLSIRAKQPPLKLSQSKPSYWGYLNSLVLNSVDQDPTFRQLQSRSKQLAVHTSFDLEYSRRSFAVIQKILKTSFKGLNNWQGAHLCVDIKTGQLSCMSGGKSFLDSEFNRSTSTFRPVGGFLNILQVAEYLRKGAELNAQVLERSDLSLYSAYLTEPQVFENEPFDNISHLLPKLKSDLYSSMPGGFAKMSPWQLAGEYLRILNPGLNKSLGYLNYYQTDFGKQRIPAQAARAIMPSMKRWNQSTAFILRDLLRRSYSTESGRKLSVGASSLEFRKQDYWHMVVIGSTMHVLWFGAEDGAQVFRGNPKLLTKQVDQVLFSTFQTMDRVKFVDAVPKGVAYKNVATNRGTINIPLRM